MRNRALCVGLLFLSSLCSCATNDVPSTGYKMYKEKQTQYIISIGGTSESLKFNSCRYAYITGDGYLEAGENLTGSVYYYVTCTLFSNSGSSRDYSDFFIYSSKNQKIIQADSTNYQYAVELIIDGALEGKTGSL